MKETMKDKLRAVLKLMRERKGYTMQQAAELAKTSKGTISGIENGSKSFTMDWAQNYAEAIGFSIEIMYQENIK